MLMTTLELVRFLSDSADELINKAASMETGDVNCLLDEAEELIALASKIMCRVAINLRDSRQAA